MKRTRKNRTKEPNRKWMAPKAKTKKKVSICRTGYIPPADLKRLTDEPLPLESVLDDPIYSLVEEDESEPLATEEGAADAEAPAPGGPLGCMLCPNKVLKNEKMVEVHLESKVSL
jgi:hypothetical protein